MAMMRMLLEITMVLGLMGGLLFVVKVLAKEKQTNKALPDADSRQSTITDSKD
jgi:hypothetical protein